MKSGYNEEVVFITYYLVCYSSFLSKKMVEITPTSTLNIGGG